jgi:hypothetical protein
LFGVWIISTIFGRVADAVVQMLMSRDVDNPDTTQTPECTKDKYDTKIKSERVSPKVSPTTCVGRRVKGRRSKGVEWIITK